MTVNNASAADGASGGQENPLDLVSFPGVMRHKRTQVRRVMRRRIQIGKLAKLRADIRIEEAILRKRRKALDRKILRKVKALRSIVKKAKELDFYSPGLEVRIHVLNPATTAARGGRGRAQDTVFIRPMEMTPAMMDAVDMPMMLRTKVHQVQALINDVKASQRSILQRINNMLESLRI